MANSILKLSVEDKEYNSKLKSAAEGIQHLAKRAHDLQGDFANLDEAELEFIKDLGHMNTSAKTAGGQVRELETAYKNLAATYNQLSDYEKNDEGGKALAASLEQLKQRAQDARSAMDEATKSLNDNGASGKESSGILDQLASKFTINIDAVKLFNVGMSAASAALDVAKDAFFNNEQQLDEWGRVVESSHSLYSGFLNALNTGDISGFLSNIDNIVKAARDAYDALDALGTYNAFNQINVERTRTGMTESIADYRGGTGSKDAVKAAGEAYKKELQDRKRLENDAYLAAVKRMASERGINAKDLQDALSGTYGHYQDLKNVQPTGVRQTVVGSGMFARTGTETFAQNRQEKLGEALRHLNDTELQSLQALGAQAQRTGNEIAQVDKQLTRVLNGRQPGGTTGGGGGTSRTRKPSFMEQQQSAWDKVLRFSNTENFMEDLRGGAPAPMMSPFQMLQAQHQQELSGIRLDSRSDFEEGRQRAKEDINEREKEKEDPFKAEKKQLAVMNDIAGNIGNVVSGLQKLGIELPEGLTELVSGIQTVISIISSIMSIVTLISALTTVKTTPIFGWLLSNGGIIGGMRGRGTIHAAGGYMIPGNNMSGDMVPALVNSGELILNRAQQSTLSSQLQGGGMQGAQLEAVVTGEQLRFVLNTNSRRRGKGEYVTSNKR